MTNPDPLLALSRDPRLKPHVVSASPAWLWAADGSRVIWANAAAAALGAATPAALTARNFPPTAPPAIEVARLAVTLPYAGSRLERLRGIRAGLGAPLTCTCSRLAVDAGRAILIVATAPAGARLALAERARRMFAAGAAPLAVFSADGTMIHATGAPLAAAPTLAAIGAERLGAAALDAGQASGDIAMGRIEIERFGAGADTVLVATLTEPVAAQPDVALWAQPDVALPLQPDVLAAQPEPALAPSDFDVSDDLVSDDSDELAIEAEPAHVAPIAIDNPVDYSVPATAAADLPATSDVHAFAVARPAAAARRSALRFVWQMDADGRFTLGSNEFADVIGPRTAALIGHPWNEIAGVLALDPEQRVSQAVASRDTWSGITVAWPIDATAERVAVELSGLPVFDRDRTFRGYRGFGVCRDVAPLDTAKPDDAPRAESAASAAATPSAPPVPVAETPAEPVAEPRPVLTVVPAAKNVVPFRIAGGAAPDKRPALSPVERTAFREIGMTLGPRPEGDEAGQSVLALAPAPAGEQAAAEPAAEPEILRADAEPVHPEPGTIPSAYAPGIEPAGDIAPAPARAEDAPQIVDQLPLAIVVYRGHRLIYANRTLLSWTGYAGLDEIAAAGGLDCLFVDPSSLPEAADGGVAGIAMATRAGDTLAVDGRLFALPWDGETALGLILVRSGAGDRGSSVPALRAALTANRELESILDTATDGVVVVERDGRIVSLNRSAAALFGYESHDLRGLPFVDLFAPESHRGALDYLDALALGGVTSLVNGREVTGRVRQGGAVPLFMTMGRLADEVDRFCAVFRDVTQWKRAEEQALDAKRQAEKASSAKSDFLAKVSHEIRTPLNAILGFSEVMMEERFGPVGNDRYREYLKDIHASGGHLVSLVNDLLDLSKIEAGKLDLVFTDVDLNELTRQCVALMQPQANRERIIIRTSLSPAIPQIVVDARSIRQIVLNLLSNSIKFTGAGGQVIVSTALTERGEAIMRVRDTGSGMSEKDIATALEPFRQLATSTRWGSGGTGLGLPLTKALAEANRATFTIKSAVNAGTLVEITFPATRVVVTVAPANSAAPPTRL